MPPVSNTTPLPTSAKGAASPSPPFHCITTTFDGLVEPWPTPSSAPMPSSASASSSSTSTSTPRSRRPSSRAANSVVVSTLAGSLVRSRVKNTPSASARSGAKAVSKASVSLATKVIEPGRTGLSPVLRAVKA